MCGEEFPTKIMYFTECRSSVPAYNTASDQTVFFAGIFDGLTETERASRS